MKRMDFENLIAFCILMQNNRGIMDKAPMYVLEKYEMKNPSLLDHTNGAIWLSYMEKWKSHIKLLPNE